MFSEKVVLITGASSGIGAATAIRFAREGAKLVLTGRNAANLQDIADKCEAENNLRPLIVTGDLSRDGDVKNILDTAVKTFGRLDVLVNNVGVLLPGDVMHPNMENYDKIFATNVRAIYLLTSLAAPHLIETKGNVVNVSSIAGVQSKFVVYSMAKAALDEFTRCLALELAPKQIRVNSVNPAAVATDIYQRAPTSEANSRQVFEKCKITHPLERSGTVEEVADEIVCVASEKGSFTTHEKLAVDIRGINGEQ